MLVNGLADDLETWVLPDGRPARRRLPGAALRQPRRRRSRTSRPGRTPPALRERREGAWSTSSGIADFHLVGVSMGGMIAQEYAHRQPRRPALADARPARTPRPGRSARGCSRCGPTWRPRLGVPFVMRDVTLWAFTQPFFEEREEELEGVRGRDGGAAAARRRVPRAALVDPDPRRDRPAAARSRRPRWCSRARRTSSSRSHLSRRLARGHPRRRVDDHARAATPASGSTPSRSTRRSSSSSRRDVEMTGEQP